jgi:hypothetical protein
LEAIVVKASPKGSFAWGKVDPSEAGRKGVEEREHRRRQRLDETREALEIRSRQVAERLTDIALGRVKATPSEVSAANSVLDRTVGKAPERVNVGEQPSENLLHVISRLDEAEQEELANPSG